MGSGIILLLFGILYVAKPGIYWTWLKDGAEREQPAQAPPNDIRYMRVLGALFMLGGILFLIV